MGRDDVRRDANGEPVPDDAPKCGAKKGSNRAGTAGFCTQPAGFGTDHLGVGPCRWHMGATPAVTAKYKEVAIEKAGRQLLVKLDVEPVENPLLELALLAGQVVAWKNAMAQRVNDIMDEISGSATPYGTLIDDEGVIVGRRDSGDIRYTSKEGAEQLRSEVLLWERALARCESVLVNIAKLNIDERLAAIDERQAEIITKALLATLNELDVASEVKQQARKAIGRHLRRVS